MAEPTRPSSPLLQANAAAVSEAAQANVPFVRRVLGVLVVGFTHLLLLDAAIETALGASAIRWLMPVVAGSVLALSMLLRRRATAGTRAWGALVVLFALEAYAVWRGQGLLMLRQHPDAVAASLTGLMILLAASSILLMKGVPAWIRIASTAVAVYGVVAMIGGLASGTPLAGLVHGQSAWARLPFWLQGGFLGVFVLMPAAVLIHVGAAVMGVAGRSRRNSAWLASASALCVAVSAPAFVAPSGSAGGIGTEGPGLGASTIPSLNLPVERTVELSHVDPAYFAAALGKDPAKIFAFVRDQVAFESYVGCLRGPRGTLLAMAGNAADRAALLASLLTHSGQRVRFAHGALSEARAAILVASMWMARPTVPGAGVPTSGAPEIEALVAKMVVAITRDDALLRDGLKKAGLPSGRGAATEAALTAEARDHYWVQWLRDGKWVDLDPSFSAAVPGATYASGAAVLDELPDALFHTVEIRIRLEEHRGDIASSRVILHHAARAADLSGSDLALIHRAAADAKGGATNKGLQMMPVLLLRGHDEIVGASFWRSAPSLGAPAGFDGLIGGEGGEPPVATASAESIEFDLVAPGARKETVIREIFDDVGPAARKKGAGASPAPVERSRVDELLGAVYDVLVTTGAIHSAHVANLAAPRPPSDDFIDIPAGLRRVNTVFAAASDSVLGRIATGRSVCRFYLDSPRLLVAELVPGSGDPRLGLDLRRDQVRAVGTGFRSEDLFYTQILRGVFEGTLETSLIDYFTASGTAEDASRPPVMSTTSLFERVQASPTTTRVLLPGEQAELGEDVPADSRARIEAALSSGQLVLMPRRAVDVEGSARYAWWQVDSRTGATTAVTDEGLHQAAVEMGMVEDKETGEYIVWTGVKKASRRDAGKWIVQRFGTREEAVSFMEQLNSHLVTKMANLIKYVEVPWWLP